MKTSAKQNDKASWWYDSDVTPLLHIGRRGPGGLVSLLIGIGMICSCHDGELPVSSVPTSSSGERSIVFGDTTDRDKALNVFTLHEEARRAATFEGRDRKDRWIAAMRSRASAELSTDSSSGWPGRGTAGLISPNAFATAFHVVFDHAGLSDPWIGFSDRCGSIRVPVFGDHTPGFVVNGSLTFGLPERVDEVDEHALPDFYLANRLRQLGLLDLASRNIARYGFLRGWHPPDATVIRDYYNGVCTGTCTICSKDEYSDGECACEEECACEGDGARDLITYHLRSHVVPGGYEPGIDSRPWLAPGVLYGWLSLAEPQNLPRYNPVWSLQVHETLTSGKNNFQHLVGEPGYVLGEQQRCSAGALSGMQLDSDDCLATTLDAIHGTSGSLVYARGEHGPSGAIGVVHRALGATEGWEDGEIEPELVDNSTRRGAVFVQLFPKTMMDDVRNFDPGSADDPEWEEVSPPKNPPRIPSRENATCVGYCESSDMVEISCRELFTVPGSEVQHGMGVGLVGGAGTKDRYDVGSLGLACKPWSMRPYTAEWQSVGVSLHQRLGALNYNKRLSPLSTVLQEGFSTREPDALEPTPTQLCPPGYLMYGMDVAFASPPGQPDAAILGINAIYCRSGSGAFPELGTTDEERRIPLGGVRDELGRSLDQWIGWADPSVRVPPVNLESLKCDYNEDEVVSSLWIAGKWDAQFIGLGIGCQTSEGFPWQ